MEACNTPLLHSELGNCLTRLKRYQEAMEHYSLALMWGVCVCVCVCV